MQTSYESEVLSLCRELVRRPSLSGQEGAAADLVAEEMAMLGYDHVARDDLGSVIGVMTGESTGPTVLIDAHLDVVPAISPESWTRPPFAGLSENGAIWGRGVVDTKGSLAAAVPAVAALGRRGMRGTLVMSASVGEEMVEGLALGYILDRCAPDMVVICEPTRLRLGIGHKGRCGLVLTTQGVAAHSSRPEAGVNAVYRMLDAVSRVRAIPLPHDELLGRGVNELVEIVSSPYPGTSMVPEGCTTRFDRRLVRGETRDSVLEELHDALRGLDGLSVAYHRAELTTYTGRTFIVEDFHPAWAMGEDIEIVRRAQRGLTTGGLDASLYLAPYCTNGATSAGERGLPTIIYGAGDITRAHGVDEHLEEEALVRCFHGYVALLDGLLRGST
jgi:putative selenium metabolism hydrolase